MKKETVHFARFIRSEEAYCGTKLTDATGDVYARINTVLRSDVTCTRCLRRIKQDAKAA